MSNREHGAARQQKTALDRTESDAIHMRFRESRPPVRVTCHSCNESFTASSGLDIGRHYREVEHDRFYKKCVYCEGKVHAFTREGGGGGGSGSDGATDKRRFYHNCFNSRRGLEK